MKNKIKKLLLLIGDIIILYSSLYLTLLVRYGEQPSVHLWQVHLLPFSLAFIFWLLIFYISDLYNINIAVNNSKFFKNTTRSVFIAGLLTAVFFYINPNINIAPKTNLVIYIIIFTLLFLGWRRLFNWTIFAKFPKENIAIIGYNQNVQELIKTLKEKPHLSYKTELVISSRVKPGILKDINIIDDIGNLKQQIIRFKISTIIFAANPHQSAELRKILFSCLPLKINFISLARFYENITGKIPLEALSQMWFLENLSEGNKHLFGLLKRSYDLALAIIILLLTAPFWPIIALLLKLENKESIFFRQTRTGKDNQTFRIIKFRTQRTIDNIPAPSSENDPRTTRIGNIFRKTRIDEIPQIINIINGDMSFIGPRPERPELVEKLKPEIPFYDERMLVKPGLSGWDQVSGKYHSPSKEDTLKKLQYDLYYVKNRSLYLDLSIMLKTIATVLRQSGV
ncbi:MAG: exopolysaccharide biosynthesis polyprenyl glycosylphosphotransferase [Patescibacteria group bacterium]|nr:exopolysaccharide biosynthesis polyprenyl glycosylphosphotransferase [Patescibacteria group bacterium]